MSEFGITLYLPLSELKRETIRGANETKSEKVSIQTTKDVFEPLVAINKIETPADSKDLLFLFDRHSPNIDDNAFKTNLNWGLFCDTH